ncbi:MAG: metal ABC transporter permease [Phycisphaerales bacterium]|nr:metal ABC transporter permease [Phycisphaerales bacterium]
MSEPLRQFVVADLTPMVGAVLASVACALLGNFLVLRRLSLMGDAISHAVLPGLVAAFLVAGSRATGVMFLGAAGAGLLTVIAVEALRRLTRIETGAAMGVVFSVMFALGVLMMKRAEGLENVDLDIDCVLNGQLELLFWAVPSSEPLLSAAGWRGFPPQVLTLLVVCAVCVAAVAVFFKELRLVSFDAGLATSLGYPAGMISAGLMVLVAGAVVASFQAVGSILVIAMLVCPPATARMLTDRLGRQVSISVAIAVVDAVVGYLLATRGPGLLGDEGGAVSAAGMMAVVSGGVLGMAVLGAPVHGVIARHARRWKLAREIAEEDILAMLYRIWEQRGAVGTLGVGDAVEALGGGHAARVAVKRLVRAGKVEWRDGAGADGGGGAGRSRGAVALTDAGGREARSLVRTHRLWETYLVEKVGLRSDHVHCTAMELEHHTTAQMRSELAPEGAAPAIDPQGKAIPPA